MDETMEATQKVLRRPVAQGRPRTVSTGGPRVAGLVALVCLGTSVLLSRQATGPVEDLPSVSDTMDEVGRRLSRSFSESKLTRLAAHGPELVSRLTRHERDALGRGYLRIHVRAPVVVDVAVPERAVPFWIHEQGFESTTTVLVNADTRWTLFRKTFPAGWIGLGVNGLDRSAPAHYAVFLRALPGQPLLEARAIRIGPKSTGDWRVVAATPGAGPAHDVRRPFTELPGELDGALLLQPRHDLRHSTLLAKGRVWKTHVPSTARPDQVTISYGADPARELVFSWRTAPVVTGTAVRLLAAGYQAGERLESNDPDLAAARLVPGSSTLIRSPDLLNDPVNRRHVVSVTDLTPDTMYLYSLGDGSPGGWGPWRTVKTGRVGPGRLEFLFMGDVQTGMEDWGQRVRSAFRRHPGVEFIQLAGDLVDRGNERTNWDHLFLRGQEEFERIPVMPAAGNHEYLDRGPQLYRSFFQLPRNGPPGIDPGLVYHFESGSAFFAVLDSTLAVSDRRLAELQARWLDEVLGKTRAAWKFVMFHHPVYASHPYRAQPVLKELWVPVFDRHHVDLVLQGHDHAYLRTYPMRADRRVSTPAEGTVYLISVAGDKFCDQPQREYIEVGFTRVSTYQTIEIDDAANRLTCRAWNDDGEVVDRLIITKPGRPASEIAQQAPDPIR